MASGRNEVDLASQKWSDDSSPEPSGRFWLLGVGAALAAHMAAAVPFLPPIDDAPVDVGLAEAPVTEIGVRLAPLVQPPEAEAPPPPEPEQEIPVIEERASDSPPPAPPEKPRETPDLPDIRPQAVPEIWLGGGGGGGLSLDEYLLLQEWLAEARLAVLEKLSYPEEARRQGASGVAMVVITATREGRIADWYFESQTGFPVLDREIRDSIRQVRRLPRFPEGTAYEELAFKLPIRFELVTSPADARRGGGAPAPAPSAQQQPQAPAAPTLTVAQLSGCAASAATLTAARDEIDAKRVELDALREDYERRAERYERERRQLPLSVRNLLNRYNRELDDYNASIADFQSRARAFQSVCGGGSTSFENYVQACRPYAATGNAYCEAYSDLWARLSQ
ncbi:MAG: TonB family protein [Pseudomonadota bacterium]